ncbi:methyltransferase domain-containing protein [bacterium]|nr:methyltransferase domain-containing protein [bacterium]
METEVRRRYASAAEKMEPQLCCPVTYDTRYLEVIPQEIIEKDYGCGDPSRHVNEGERVLDLGSGGGKICYILAQRVGPEGSVAGVDFNDAMLALARRHQDDVARRLGYANVSFVKGRIQDLALNLEMVQHWLDANPVRSVEDMEAYDAECARLRRFHPLIPDASVDVVVSNCVLNLVRSEEKEALFREIRRVLRPGGRAVISDIVSDETPPDTMRADPELWSGCISGALREDEFLSSFEESGFYGCEILDRSNLPWQTIQGIEFRSLTLRAYAGKEGPCLERNQAVIYKGPRRKVIDDDGHTLTRGRRMAVCDKTYRILTDTAGPYANSLIPVPPAEAVPLEEATAFDCRGSVYREPAATKGRTSEEVADLSPACASTSGCC